MKYQGKITDPKDLVTKEYVDTGLSGKLGTSGDGSNVTAAFTAASSRTNISTGEKLSVIFGKIAKWFADLGAAAFRGVDAAPTANSTNLVESGGVKSAIDDVKIGYTDINITGQAITSQDSGGYYGSKTITNLLPSGVVPISATIIGGGYTGGISYTILNADGQYNIIFAASKSCTISNTSRRLRVYWIKA